MDMKKQWFLFIGLSIISLGFFACKEANNIKLTPVNFANTYYLSADSTQGSLAISIQVELPIEKTRTDSIIRTFLIENIFSDKYITFSNDSTKKYTRLSNDSIVASYVRELEQDYRANNEPLLAEMADEEHLYSFNNEHQIEGFPLLNDPNIFSYGINRYAFMGGAHGLEIRSYYNFNLKTAKLITEQDLFVDNYQKDLIELFKARIIEESDFIHSMEELKASDYWLDSIKPNSNFYISDEAITYVFNPYEIAPYYVGHTEISLPYDRIANLLKPNNPIAYLTKK